MCIRDSDQPVWWVPALAIALILALYTAVNMHIIMPETFERQLEFASGDEAVVIEQQLEMFTDPAVWLRVLVGLGAGLFGGILTILLPTLVLHLFLKLSEGQGQLKQSLGVVFWASLIAYGWRTLVSWVIVVVTGSSHWANLTVTGFLADVNPQSLPMTLAQLYGDPFMYWTLAVAVLGLAMAHRLTLGRVAVVTVATYVLLSAIPIAATLLGRAMSGS